MLNRRTLISSIVAAFVPNIGYAYPNKNLPTKDLSLNYLAQENSFQQELVDSVVVWLPPQDNLNKYSSSGMFQLKSKVLTEKYYVEYKWKIPANNLENFAEIYN